MIEPLNSDAILTALDQFRGSIFDLDNNCRLDACGFAIGWNDLAKQLGKRGLLAGQIVVIAVHNGPLFPAALAAVLSHGATPLLLHGSTPLLELVRHARKVGSSFLLREPCSTSQLDESGVERAEIVVAGSESDKLFATAAWYQLEASCEIGFSPNLGGVPLHPTSGTTGESKLAARAGHCCMKEVEHIIHTIEARQSDRFLICVPMSHAYGYGMGTMVPIVANATIMTMRHFNPRAALRALFKHEITIFPAAPAMLDLMLKVGAWPNPPPRLILAAGSPLSEKTATEFRNKVNARVRLLYGTTESGTISISTSEEAEQPGCVGKPMHGIEVQLQPLKDAASDAHGEIGLLHVRSSSMMSGYYKSNCRELETVPQGWFNTGDLAKIDPSGAIHLVGRAKEIIDVSGLKVIPKEVEDVLAAIDGVIEVAVYAGKHRSGCDIVKAAIVASRELPISEVRGHCEQRLVAYKRPEIVTQLSFLPRSPSGKILRDQLP